MRTVKRCLAAMALLTGFVGIIGAAGQSSAGTDFQRGDRDGGYIVNRETRDGGYVLAREMRDGGYIVESRDGGM